MVAPETKATNGFSDSPNCYSVVSAEGTRLRKHRDQPTCASVTTEILTLPRKNPWGYLSRINHDL